MESEILDKSKINTIGHWLKDSNKLGKYKLCSRRKNHRKKGDSPCKGFIDTISVVKIALGTNSYKYYGGFTNSEFDGELIFKEKKNKALLLLQGLLMVF